MIQPFIHPFTRIIPRLLSGELQSLKGPIDKSLGTMVTNDPWDDPSSAFGAKQRRSWHASCNMAIDVTLLIQLIRDEQPESYLKIFENSMNTLTT